MCIAGVVGRRLADRLVLRRVAKLAQARLLAGAEVLHADLEALYRDEVLRIMGRPANLTELEAYRVAHEMGVLGRSLSAPPPGGVAGADPVGGPVAP